MAVFASWYEQYRLRKPISVTHPLATRYFIPLDEAASFTLKALNIMKGGEIFIPPSQKFNMYKLATRLNRPIKIVGLRPSDRLSEELLTMEERRRARKASGMWVIR
jgi:FlaA1/EpsC-like NDP-sugar epimerase